ncbi:hypothetical protein H8S95_01000 [Pontibacter sp. KCTC 32443]|uniref:hypothetical protein n=1 Tax=Pontibacter TaxID=323449 RepID=UPI00164D32F7|nr:MULTISPECIES: hypothetical protein [Pontibacter]MBC5772624.1 hypothetical protein [Pontibacter sp. KCTC 32443]
MRVRKLNDADTLEILSIGYRMQRVIYKEYSLPPLEAAIITLLGSYSNRPSEEILSLSVPEITVLLAYSKSNRVAVYYATHKLCEGESPYLVMHKGKPNTYSLTAKGVEVVRAAISLSKEFRYEIAQVAA